MTSAAFQPAIVALASAPHGRSSSPVRAVDAEDSGDADEAEALLASTAQGGCGTRSVKEQKETERLGRGFVAYSVASEVFVIVSGTLFLPIALETYARANGFLGPGHVEACPAGGGGTADGDAVRCNVRVLGAWVDTASFSLMTYSTSVLLQALTVISMGSLADSPHTRYRLLLLFALTGSSLLLLFLLLPDSSHLWPLCTLLAAGANVCFGASIVCLNSYLPDLGRRDPLVRHAHSALLLARQTFARLASSSSPSSSPSSPSFPSSSSSVPTRLPTRLDAAHSTLLRAESSYTQARGLATSRISSRAIAAGYAAGIVGLVGLVPVVRWLSTDVGDGEGQGGGSATWPLRVAIAASGGWWMVGTIPSAVWLRPPSSSSFVPSTPFSVLADPFSSSKSSSAKSKTLGASIKQGWRGLWVMLGEWRRLPQTFVFLAAWFVLSDCFATLTSTAMLFAKTTLNLPTASLILIAILTPLSGILGALLFPFLQKRGFRRFPSPPNPPPTSTDAGEPGATVSNKKMLVGLVAATLAVPAWGLVHLRTAGEMYALACVFGALYGAFQSYARTCFAELVPSSQSTRWFGLYSITDKGSSFLGPLLVAGITDATGEIRHGFYIILSLLLLSLPILLKVDMRTGSADAEAYDTEMRERAALDAAGGDEEESGGEGERERLVGGRVSGEV